MSPLDAHELAAATPPLVPLAWNFVVPAFLGFLVGSTYVLAFGLAAAVVVWIGSSVLFGMWLVTGLYPFNRLALIGYAVGGALVLRAACELTARTVRRAVGRVRPVDLRDRDREWAGDEAVALGRLARAGVRVAPSLVDRRAGAGIVRAEVSSRGRPVFLSTRRPGGGPVSLARVEWADGACAVELDRVAVRPIGTDGKRAERELPLAACFALLDRAEASGVGAVRLGCAVTRDGILEVVRCEAMEAAGWTDVWLAGAGVDLAADPVTPLEQELTEAAWGWDRLLLGRRSPDDVRFVAHRPYVSFEAAHGGSRRPGADHRGAGPLGADVLALGVLLRDLLGIGRGAPCACRLAVPNAPHDAVAWIAHACRDGLAPMMAWSALALRAVRWIEALVGERARRDELLARIQAPEARALDALVADVVALRAALGDGDPAVPGAWWEVEAQLGLDPTGAERRRALGAFLERHGHRGPGERTLAGSRLIDGPAVLRAFLAGPVLSERASSLPGRSPSSRASLLASLDPFEWWTSAVAALGSFAMRRRVAARERATRRLAALRTALLAHGAVLVEQGAFASRDDVFWLSLPDWRALLEGAADPRAAVAGRRRAFEADAARPACALIVEGEVSPASRDRDARVLHGIATSAGVVRGRAVGLVDEPAGAGGEAAEVLVLDDANPALAARLASVAAVVCERGGLLSHLAIVARELGVPAVMGVADAARLLAPGAWVEVDGGRGEVRLLDAPGTAAGVSVSGAGSPARGSAAPVPR